VGPVKEALQFGQRRRGLDEHFFNVLVLVNIEAPSSSSRSWNRRGLLVSTVTAMVLDRRKISAIVRTIDMADAFPRVEVIGVDLAPIQPK